MRDLVYRPEEHIDNPKGYDEEAQKVNSKLREPVQNKELEIDETTGMKNYIANESLGISTSSAYIRGKLREAINLGRSGRKNEDDRNEALICLGAALHCLEG